MPLPKKISLCLLCLVAAACQKSDLTALNPDDYPSDYDDAPARVRSTGDGLRACPYTVADIRSRSLAQDEPVWVIGYMVGTARQTMNNAVFRPDADNQSNILLASDSLCTDTTGCIPVELSQAKWKRLLSVPMNTEHFGKCLLVKAIPSTYLKRKGLQNVSAGLWMDGFDISTVAPTEWGLVGI